MSFLTDGTLEAIMNGGFFYIMQAFDYQQTIFNTGNYMKKIKELTEFKFVDSLEETLQMFRDSPEGKDYFDRKTKEYQKEYREHNRKKIEEYRKQYATL